MKQKKTENITACHSKEKELQFGYKKQEGGDEKSKGL